MLGLPVLEACHPTVGQQQSIAVIQLESILYNMDWDRTQRK